MSEHKYPRLVSVFKGEQRLLVIPIIDHIGGYSIDSEWFVNIRNTKDVQEIGNGVFSAIEVIENSPISRQTQNEFESSAAWKKNSKYKGWVSFWRNNFLARVKVYENGDYEIYSTEKFEGHKGVYNGCIKKHILPPTATAEEIGEAIIDVFKAAEEFYEKKK